MPRTRLSVHVYPSAFEYDTRILKVTKTLTTRSLAERVLVVASAKQGLAREESIDAARSVVRIDAGRRGRGFVARSVWFAVWSVRVLLYLRRVPVSMVNCHSLSVLPLCVAIKLWHGSLLVYEPHELETETEMSVGLRRKLAKLVERALIPMADRIFVVSESIAKAYAHDYGLSDIGVVLNAPELDADLAQGSNDLLRKRFDIPDDAVVFMFQGVFDQGRGARILLEAFRTLTPSHHIVFMGFGPLESEIRDAANQNRNIHVHPPVPPGDVVQYTRGADVGIALLADDCLNHRCALPNKLFHYLHAGLPVIVSDLPEMAALVSRYECGWRVAGDAKSLAAIIGSVGMADLAPLRAGALRAREDCNWDREAEKVVQAYGALLGATSKKPYAVCSRCVMDTSVPDIVFDEFGECNYCRAASERMKAEHFATEEHSGRLEALIDTIKREGAGKPYDCIIGVSGGVDSSYVAWLVKRRFGLRPLAVHFDNGWNSELAVDNIERLLKHLEIDLSTYVVDWEEFRDLQLAFLASSIANSEIPTDHGITALLYRTAARHGVRYILHGGNIATESIMPSSWMENALDYRLLRAIHDRFGNRPLTTFPTLSMKRLAYYTLVKRIRYIGVLNYVAYNRHATMQFLEEQCGWRRYAAKHFESTYTRWFQGYLLPKKFGMDKRRPHLSSLIVSGQISRAKALEELELEIYGLDVASDHLEYVCRKFQLNPSEFAKLMALPPKGVSDYPNSEWIARKLAPLVARVRAFATARQ